MRGVAIVVFALAFASPCEAQGDPLSQGLASAEFEVRGRAIYTLRREWDTWSPQQRRKRLVELASVAGRPQGNPSAVWTLGDLAEDGDSQARNLLLDLCKTQDLFLLKLLGRASARGGRETRDRATRIFLGRLPERLSSTKDIAILVELARLGWNPRLVLARFQRALRESPGEAVVYEGLDAVWWREEPLVREGGTELATQLLGILANASDTTESDLAIRSIATIGSAAAPIRKELVATQLATLGDKVAEAIRAMGPSAKDVHSEIVAHWKQGAPGLTWRGAYPFAPNDPRVVAKEDAILRAGPTHVHWETAIKGLALRRAPHEKFSELAGSLILDRVRLEEAAQVLEAYSYRPDRSSAMQACYLEALGSKYWLLAGAAAAALGRSQGAMKSSAREFLIQLLHEGGAATREPAAHALVRLDGRGAYSELAKALGEPRTALVAIQALGLLGRDARGALPTLREIVEGVEIADVDMIEARRRARQALRRVLSDNPRLP